MRTALPILVLAGCNTAALFDLDPQEVVTTAVVGAQIACEGEGVTLAVVLLDQTGGPVLAGGRRIPELPADLRGALSLDLRVDGATVSARVEAAELVQQPEDAVYDVVIDRSETALAGADPGDRSAQHLAASVAQLLKHDVAGVRVLSSSGAGLHTLSDRPFTDFDRVERAIERDLLPPYGDDALLANLAAAGVRGPTLVWVIRPGPPAALPDGAPHVFISRDHDRWRDEDAAPLAAAVCETKGVWLHLPNDTELEIDALAGSWAPSGVRSHLRLRVVLEPPPPPGARLTGTVRVDVRALVGDGPAIPAEAVTGPIDALLGPTGS